MVPIDGIEQLRHLIRTHPLIDNHCHNLLSARHAANYDKYAFECIASDAGATALSQTASKTLPYARAVKQLAQLYDCAPDWQEIKRVRKERIQEDYEGLVRQCLLGTQSLLLDDLLTDDGVEPFQWHNRFSRSPSRRIVRIESVAAHTIGQFADCREGIAFQGVYPAVLVGMSHFSNHFDNAIMSAFADPAVVGFKSVICYRTGLDVDLMVESDATTQSYAKVACASGHRIDDKPLNDWLVLRVLDLLREAQKEQGIVKPLQFHTGLGDPDLDLLRANPAHLQAVIEAYPEVSFVLLHSSYPYTQQAGYLACSYPNVYLDLGEVFPMVSRDGQERILRQAFELTPTSRLLWSTDGHFFPETYWLSNKQFREVLEKVYDPVYSSLISLLIHIIKGARGIRDRG